MFCIKSSNKKGMGMFATKNISKGEIIYSLKNRISIPRNECEHIIKLQKDIDAIRMFLSHGWAKDNDFIIPIGVEAFVNHSNNANSRNGIAIKDIMSGEEILENYLEEYDGKPNWYTKLANKYNVWLAK